MKWLERAREWKKEGPGKLMMGIEKRATEIRDQYFTAGCWNGGGNCLPEFPSLLDTHTHTYIHRHTHTELCIHELRVPSTGWHQFPGDLSSPLP